MLVARRRVHGIIDAWALCFDVPFGVSQLGRGVLGDTQRDFAPLHSPPMEPYSVRHLHVEDATDVRVTDNKLELSPGATFQYAAPSGTMRVAGSPSLTVVVTTSPWWSRWLFGGSSVTVSGSGNVVTDGTSSVWINGVEAQTRPSTHTPAAALDITSTPLLSITVSGSGDVIVSREAMCGNTLRVVCSGSGDITFEPYSDRCLEKLTVESTGSGDVSCADGDVCARLLRIESIGSGDVRGFRAKYRADLLSNSSGDISVVVDSACRVSERECGSGDISTTTYHPLELRSTAPGAMRSARSTRASGVMHAPI